jgi:transcription elongation factor S-II
MATMDGKTLFSTGKQIQKAIESGDSGESLLNILQPLTKWTATEDLLRQSKIGVIVSKLRQQKDPKVVEQASKLVNKWKQDVNASKKKAVGSASPAPSAGAAKSSAATNGKSSGTSSPAPPAAAVKKEPKKSTADPAKRNSVVDGISTAVTGNQTRDACVKLMYDGLAFMSEEGKSCLAITVDKSMLTLSSSGRRYEGRPQRRAGSIQRLPTRNFHHLQAEDAITFPEPQNQEQRPTPN